MKTWLAFWYGIFKNNPTFGLVLGLCPTLAVTTSLENALGMGLAATFVLVCSNALVSALRKVIPGAVHIPCYIVIIATFVTAIDLLMQAYLPDLSASLGIFIPLIVVNCIILGRLPVPAHRAVAAVEVDRQRSGRAVAARVPFADAVDESEKKPEHDEAAGRKDRQRDGAGVDALHRDVAPHRERPRAGDLPHGRDEREREREADAAAKTVCNRINHPVLARERLGAAENDAVHDDERNEDA